MEISSQGNAAFLSPHSRSNEDILTDAAFRVVADRGLAALTMGEVARLLRVSPAVVTRRAGSRDRFVQAVVQRFAARWRSWVEASPWRADPPFRLAVDDVERHAALMWSAVRELARGEALAGRRAPLDVVGRVQAAERECLAGDLRRRLGRAVSEVELDGFVALVDAVRLRMADPVDPWSRDRARDVLRAQLRLLGAPEPDDQSTFVDPTGGGDGPPRWPGSRNVD